MPYRGRVNFSLVRLVTPFQETDPDASIDLSRPQELADRLVLVTQTSRQPKRWTSDGWRAVINVALSKFSDIVLPVGSDSEFEAVSAITEGLPVPLFKIKPR